MRVRVALILMSIMLLLAIPSLLYIPVLGEPTITPVSEFASLDADIQTLKPLMIEEKEDVLTALLEPVEGKLDYSLFYDNTGNIKKEVSDYMKRLENENRRATLEELTYLLENDLMPLENEIAEINKNKEELPLIIPTETPVLTPVVTPVETAQPNVENPQSIIATPEETPGVTSMDVIYQDVTLQELLDEINN